MNILSHNAEIKKQMELMHNQRFEIERLKREFEKHKHIELIRRYDGPMKSLEEVVKEAV